MNFEELLLILLLLYSPFYFGAVLYCALNFKKFFKNDRSISTLGTKTAPKRYMYNWTTILYGVLILAGTFALSTRLPALAERAIIVKSMLVLGWSTVLLGFTPVDQYRLPHNLFGGAILLFGVVVGVFCTKLSLASEFFPLPLIAINSILQLCCLIFLVSVTIFFFTHRLRRFTWRLEWVWLFFATWQTWWLAYYLL